MVRLAPYGSFCISPMVCHTTSRFGLKDKFSTKPALLLLVSLYFCISPMVCHTTSRFGLKDKFSTKPALLLLVSLYCGIFPIVCHISSRFSLKVTIIYYSHSVQNQLCSYWLVSTLLTHLRYLPYSMPYHISI